MSLWWLFIIVLTVVIIIVLVDDSEEIMLSFAVITLGFGFMGNEIDESLYEHTSTNEIEIHSTASSKMIMNGSFFLGSGSIHSEEVILSYIRVDNHFERKYIKMKDLKIIEDSSLENKAILVETECFDTNLFGKDIKVRCDRDDTDRELRVPVNTIIQQVKL